MADPAARTAAAALREPAQSDRRALLAILVLLSALAPAALHMLVPALPLLGDVFDRPPAAVERVLSVFLAGIAVGQLVYGPLSDRFGRRPAILAGLALFVAGTVLCGLARSLPALVLGRAIEALGGCAGMVLSRAIVRDLFDRERAASAIALIAMAMSAAPAIAPALGAWLAQWGIWRADFALLGLAGTGVLALVAARLPETRVGGAPLRLAGMAASFAALLRQPAFLGFALATAFTSASWFTFVAGAPYLLSDLLHEPPSTYGLMILLPMGAYMLGSAAAVRFSVRLGSARLFVFGLALSLLSGVLLILWPIFAGLSPWALFVPMALSSIGNGISQPAGIAAGLSIYPRVAGAASGLIGFLQMGLAALGTVIVGALPGGSALPGNLVVGAAMLSALCCGLFALGRPEPIAC